MAFFATPASADAAPMGYGDTRTGKRPRERDTTLLQSPSEASESSGNYGGTTKNEMMEYQREVMEVYSYWLRCAAPVSPAAQIALSRDVLNQRYRRLVKIGEGTFGEVFIVYDTKSECFLTMKRMRRVLHSPGGTLSGLHNTAAREVMLLSSLQHKNVVPLLDYHIVSDGSLVLLLPAVGHDLVSLMSMWRVSGPLGEPSKGRMPLPVIKCLFRQMMEGVEYLHSRKVWHRDIKPTNIMVDHDGVLKLVDFGWARCVAVEPQVTLTGPACTVKYRPPEMLIGGRCVNHYDEAVDLWCCGCILFELVTGGTTFVHGNTISDALQSIVQWLGSPSPQSAIYYGSKAATAEPQKKKGSAERVTCLPLNQTRNFAEYCARRQLDKDCVHLLSRLLRYEPAERWRASRVLQHPWLSQPPAACAACEIPLPPRNTYRFLERGAKRRRTHEHSAGRALLSRVSLSAVATVSLPCWLLRIRQKGDMSLIRRVASAMEEFAPLHLADRSWDNVGTLIECPSPNGSGVVFLTNDLTSHVLRECVELQAEVIVSYHPPIFSPFKRLSLSDPKQRIVLEVIRGGMSVYSPHTALDATVGGINDWLAKIVDPHGLTTPIQPVSSAAEGDGAGGTDVGTLQPGYGRVVQLQSPRPFSVLVDDVKQRLQLSSVRVGLPPGWSNEQLVSSVALCAGSGSGVFRSLKGHVDVLLTGELGHHDALAALEKGQAVILCEHSNTERGFLREVLQQRLQAALGASTSVIVSKVDKDPLEGW